MTSKPRFIAGAVCPACGETDRTVLEVGDAERVRTCIACGHREVQRRLDAPVPEGRFDRSGVESSGVAPVAVRVLETPAPRRGAEGPSKKKE